MSSSTEQRASWDTELIPHAFSRFSWAGPSPGMPRNGISCTNCACLSSGMSSMPFGFAFVLAIFATSLLPAMPTEQVMPNRSATCARNHWAMRVGCAMRAAHRRHHIAFIDGDLFDAVRHLAEDRVEDLMGDGAVVVVVDGRKIPFGQSWCARAAGIAELMPYLRAS